MYQTVFGMQFGARRQEQPLLNVACGQAVPMFHGTEALDQLTWALSVADADYPPRNRSTDLGTQVNALAQR